MASQFKRAMILLKANEEMIDAQIMAAVNISCLRVEHIRKRFVEDGLERALNKDPQLSQSHKLDG